MARRSWARLGPPAAIAAVTAFLLRDVLFGGRIFYYRDVHLQWIVQAEALVGSVAGGSWPVWNRFVSFGQPLLANPNAGVFYPFTWLLLVLPPWTCYTVFVAVHTAVAGAGAYRLARRLGLGRKAATTTALVWIASGPFASLAHLWNHLAGAAWIPWSGWAADRAAATGRAGAALTWGLTLAAPILAGSPETALMAGGLGALVAARRMPAVGARRTLAAGALAVAFSLGVSAAQWMPSLALARRSMRARYAASQANLWSVPPPLLAQMAAPALLDPLPIRADLRARLFDGREPFLASLYLGAAAAGLVAAAVAAGRGAWSWAVLWAACVLFALGRHGPLYPALTWLVPPAQALRFPAKAMILGALAWAVAAGYGVEAVARGDRAAARALRAAALVLSVLLGTAAIVLALRPDTLGLALVEPAFTRRTMAAVLAPVSASLGGAALFGLAAAALATIAVRRDAERPAAGGLLAALVAAAAADLGWAHRNLNHTADPELLRFRPSALAHLAGAPPLSRVYSYDYLDGDQALRHLGHPGYLLKVPRDAWPFPWADAAALRVALYPSVLGQWRVETAYGIDALGLYSPELSALTSHLRRKEGTPTHRRLLEMGGVGRVAALHRHGFEDLRLRVEVPTLFLEDLAVYDVPDPLPRAYAVDGVRVVDAATTARTLEDPAFDPRREILLPEGVPARPDPAFQASVRVTGLRADRTRVDAELSRPGYVVLVDTWDPGWRATVDGTPTPVLRANVGFQAVPVPAGRHRVELAYRPPAILAGIITSMAAAGAALAVALGRRPRGQYWRR